MKIHGHKLAQFATACGATLLACAVGLGPRPVAAQTMPGPVYHDLTNRGYEKLASRISKKLELRSDPDDEDVQALLDRWTREEGGPDGGWDWIAVARLWLRAGSPDEAEAALLEAEEAGGVPTAVLSLDRARVDFLAGRSDRGAEAYWNGCADAGEAAYREYWLDIEVLATPAELDDWDRFRRLPITQTDLCRYLRRFWAERALSSALDVSERLTLHYERVRHALDNYRRRGGKKGPTFSNQLGRPTNSVFDDRGLLFVRMGSPDRVTTFAGNTGIGQRAVSAECYQPNESWAYDYPEGTRVYHLTTLTGTDDYWLVANLGLVYRCGDPSASLAGAGGSSVTGVLSPVNENRFVALGPAASLVLQDLYRSRQGLDPRYARIAQHMNDQGNPNETRLDPALSEGSEALESHRMLQREREWTRGDGMFAVDSVPDRPPVAADARLLVEELQFRSPREGMTRVWLNTVVEGETLEPVPLPGGGFKYRVEARWIVVDGSGEARSFPYTVEAAAPRRLGRDESLPVRMAADLVPGQYRYTFLVRDDSPGTDGALGSGNYRRGDLTVREVVASVPAISDVAVAPDSGGTWSATGGIRLKPSPAHLTGADGVAYVYYEVYNLTPGGQYTTRVRLAPQDDDRVAFDLSYPSDGAAGLTRTARRLLRLDLRDTPQGRYTMEVTVSDESSGASTLPYYTPIIVNRADR